MGYKIGLTDAAQADLATLVGFIAEKNPEAAVRIGEEVLDTALSLAVFPRRGSPVRRRPGMRKLTCRYYLIFYPVNETERWIEIIRIWDGRQDPESFRLP